MIVNGKAIHALKQFHFQSHYYSEQDSCPAGDMPDLWRGTITRPEAVRSLTESECLQYWNRCDCELKETVEGLL